MAKFNVIVYDPNLKKFVPFDVVTCLVNEYKTQKPADRPKTHDEFKEFIIAEARYRWWGRCEYELILRDWPNEKESEKWDVYEQLMLNIDALVDILMTEVSQRKKSERCD